MLAVHHVEYQVSARSGFHAGYHGEPMQLADEWPEALRIVWLNGWDAGRRQREEDARGGVLVVIVKPGESPRSLVERFCEWCFGK